MKFTAEGALFLGWIVKMCAQEEDMTLLDLIYKILAQSSPGGEVD